MTVLITCIVQASDIGTSEPSFTVLFRPMIRLPNANGATLKNIGQWTTIDRTNSNPLLIYNLYFDTCCEKWNTEMSILSACGNLRHLLGQWREFRQNGLVSTLRFRYPVIHHTTLRLRFADTSIISYASCLFACCFWSFLFINMDCRASQ